MHLVGSPALVKAWLDGDFNIIEGAYFPEFSQSHILPPFKISKHWVKYLGFDWGYNAPFCAVWGAVSSGKNDDGTESKIPKGAIVIYREYSSNRMSNPDIGRAIKKLSEGEEITISEADPSIFKEEGGPSIAEQILDSGDGWSFSRADNDRLSGWMEIRRKLLQKPDPMIYIFSTCGYLIQSFGSCQVSPKNAEDLDTEGDDHAMDALRYLVKARVNHKDYSQRIEVVRQGKVIVSEYVKQARSSRNRIEI